MRQYDMHVPCTPTVLEGFDAACCLFSLTWRYSRLLTYARGAAGVMWGCWCCDWLGIAGW